MTTEGVNRKLTAILHADVKDYSRLMADAENERFRGESLQFGGLV